MHCFNFTTQGHGRPPVLEKAAKEALDAEKAWKDKLKEEKAARAALTTAAKDARNAEKAAKDLMNVARAAKDALRKDLKESEAQRKFEQDRRLAEEGRRCELEERVQKMHHLIRQASLGHGSEPNDIREEDGHVVVHPRNGVAQAPVARVAP